MASAIIPVRAFEFNLDQDRFLYHSIVVNYNGQQANRTVWTGTLVVDISLVGQPGRFTLMTKKVWGSRAGIAGVKLPRRFVLENMFGTQLISRASCSIELVTRATAVNPITFTERTNLGVAP